MRNAGSAAVSSTARAAPSNTPSKREAPSSGDSSHQPPVARADGRQVQDVSRVLGRQAHVVPLAPPQIPRAGEQVLAGSRRRIRPARRRPEPEPSPAACGADRGSPRRGSGRCCRAWTSRSRGCAGCRWRRTAGSSRTAATGCCPPDPVHRGDERREVARRVPVADAHLVFLRVEVLLADPAPHGHVLAELVAAVDAVGRAERRREHQPDPEAARPPVCRYSCRMSGVFANRFGRMYSRTSVCVSSVKYSRQLVAGVPPGEVACTTGRTRASRDTA